jgi:hypothetical protein
MKFKEVIAVNNKLEKVCDRYVTVLNNTLKPTKSFYKMMLEKHNMHPTKSQPYLFGNCSKLRNPPSFFNKSIIKNTFAFAQC